MRNPNMPQMLPESAKSPSRFHDPRGDEAADILLGRREVEPGVLPRTSAMLPEESLVDDGRSSVSPAQMVENKLMSLLQGASLPVSQLQMRGLVRNYRQS